MCVRAHVCVCMYVLVLVAYPFILKLAMCSCGVEPLLFCKLRNSKTGGTEPLTQCI